MRNKKLRPGQVGRFWPSKKPGRTKETDAWQLTWYDKGEGQLRHRSLGTTNIDEARLEVARYAMLDSNPDKGDRSDVQIARAIAWYWEEHARNIPSSYTVRKHLDLWLDYWGNRCVGDITRVEQGKFRKFLGEDTLKPSTIDHILSTGRAALNWAADTERLDSVPKITLIETEEDRRSRPPMAKPIGPEEAARLIDEIRHPHLMMFVILSMMTLSRPCAIYDLRRAQYNPDEGTLNLNPAGRRQTKKYRPIVLVTPSLKPWLDSVTDPNGLYVSIHYAKMRNLNPGIKDCLERAGLPSNIAGYSFRHGVARWMRDERVPEEQISHYLGHLAKGGARTTRIYAPFEAKHCSEAAAAIESYVSEVRERLKVARLDEPAYLTRAQLVFGRKKNVKLSPATASELMEAIRSGEGYTEVIKRFGISSPTYYRYRNQVLDIANASRATRVPIVIGSRKN